MRIWDLLTVTSFGNRILGLLTGRWKVVCQLRFFRQGMSQPGMAAVMLWTAKALQKVIRLAQRITRTELPAFQQLHRLDCKRKADKIISDLCHPSYTLFMLLQSGSWCRSIPTCTSKFKNNFYPQAIRILNCLKNWTSEFSCSHFRLYVFRVTKY